MLLIFTSRSGCFTPREEPHSTHWPWCWMGLYPSQKVLEKETLLFPVENWTTISWPSIT